MKIAMIASEASPFAKTGGLADVLGTLSPALERLGHEVTRDSPGLPQRAPGRVSHCKRPA